jgi:hypothetical protein
MVYGDTKQRIAVNFAVVGRQPASNVNGPIGRLPEIAKSRIAGALKGWGRHCGNQFGIRYTCGKYPWPCLCRKFPAMKNTLCFGDNLEVLQRHFEDDSVDLVYLDPTFRRSGFHFL